MTVAALVALLTLYGRSPRRHRNPQPASSLLDLVELLALATAGGMSLHAALRWSRDFVAPVTAAELERVLRHATRVGLARALRMSNGPSAPLCRQLARSIETGAAVGPALASVRDGTISEELARVESALQRLPVKLAFPLALLMLPGLLLMIVAPALFDVLSRFG